MIDDDFFKLHDAVKRLEARVQQLTAAPLVRIKRVGAADLPLPRYETEGAAGFDLRLDLTMPVKLPFGAEVHMGVLRLHPGERLRVYCGFAFEIPAGWEGRLMGRSSGPERALYVAPADIDSDFRGPVGIHVENRGANVVTIENADRIAQVVICHAPQARLEEVGELSPTARNAGGFGSTGVR